PKADARDCLRNDQSQAPAIDCLVPDRAFFWKVVNDISWLASRVDPYLRIFFPADGPGMPFGDGLDHTGRKRYGAFFYVDAKRLIVRHTHLEGITPFHRVLPYVFRRQPATDIADSSERQAQGNAKQQFVPQHTQHGPNVGPKAAELVTFEFPPQ